MNGGGKLTSPLREIPLKSKVLLRLTIVNATDCFRYNGNEKLLLIVSDLFHVCLTFNLVNITIIKYKCESVMHDEW